MKCAGECLSASGPFLTRLQQSARGPQDEGSWACLVAGEPGDPWMAAPEGSHVTAACMDSAGQVCVAGLLCAAPVPSFARLHLLTPLTGVPGNTSAGVTGGSQDDICGVIPNQTRTPVLALPQLLGHQLPQGLLSLWSPQGPGPPGNLANHMHVLNQPVLGQWAAAFWLASASFCLTHSPNAAHGLRREGGGRMQVALGISAHFLKVRLINHN